MGKGEQTRERILERAVQLASRDGLDGLTIGILAEDLGLSKSGLFAHFGSKEGLQLQVLESTVERFREEVVRPALKAPRGEARLRALFDHWMKWTNDPGLPGGCVMIQAAVELDDQPGPPRDFLVASMKDLHGMLAKAARLAVEAGDFRDDVDPAQFAFEFYGIILGYHHARRLLREPKAEARARAAFDRLLADARR
jgi:AcrR family transcriptional regulator